MKQSAAKTLGVAALGAAVAAVGAGAANAAPATPDAGRTLNTVTKALPAEGIIEALPDSGAMKLLKPLAERGVATAVPAVGKGVAAAQPTAESVLAKGPTGPVGGLLGGMPLQGLPTHGVPVNGIALG
ncbi:ATP-binding protein [Streptomyces dangxiongensis]|uniref:ATP-binding protein n=1 Tax=Streptomyces dangxiongensis TaxID=1442032 RepID=A0A3G2JJN4_9ACTN|nr:ATP-binding protein [Streptomyces dangxiongensis]AYN39747.1 ATP-binding protein [Streptomyces dangxiongensis]